MTDPDIQAIIIQGKKLLEGPPDTRFETGLPAADVIYLDLENYSHVFVLGCLMHRRVGSERAWLIPYEIGQTLGSFDFQAYGALSQEEVATLFSERKLHPFYEDQARFFFSAIRKIESEYGAKASRIWEGTPRSAKVVRRFLEFEGAGIKIATMATNILVRSFKIPMEDYSSIDISPDSRVRRYFESHGLLRPKAKIEEIIYLARELCPEYPGVFDLPFWEGGVKFPKKE